MELPTRAKVCMRGIVLLVLVQPADEQGRAGVELRAGRHAREVQRPWLVCAWSTPTTRRIASWQRNCDDHACYFIMLFKQLRGQSCDRL